MDNTKCSALPCTCTCAKTLQLLIILVLIVLTGVSTLVGVVGGVYRIQSGNEAGSIMLEHELRRDNNSTLEYL